ncbi:MAG: IclR family transcriptional regulator, partial [Anaerotignaceae bacterium]
MNKSEHRGTSRVLDILELLASSETGYTLTEIAKIIGAPKSSIFPMIHTLEERHYISMSENTFKYRIGVSTFAVGSTYVNSQNLLSHINNEMIKLVEICNETCSLGILDGSNVLYIAKKDSPQSLRLVTYVGKQVSANC